MSTERQILRHNDRNISYKDSVDGKYLFTKISVSCDTNPAEEYSFWEYFYELKTGMIPFCVQTSPKTKIIQYEWLDGYEQISGRYRAQYLEQLLVYLDLNAKVNTFDRLRNDLNLVSLSEKRLQQQLAYYSDIRDKAVIFYNGFLSEKKFEESFDLSIEGFCQKDVLCHGDLGKSNILVKGNDVKIIDYEYSMFSSKELDYARLLSSVFLSYQNQEINKSQFLEMVLMITKSPLELDKLARLSGLQLTMRIIHMFGKEEKIPEFAHSLAQTALNLLSANEIICTNQAFLSLFVI